MTADARRNSEFFWMGGPVGKYVIVIFKGLGLLEAHKPQTRFSIRYLDFDILELMPDRDFRLLHPIGDAHHNV
jgi:hypothetical protein